MVRELVESLEIVDDSKYSTVVQHSKASANDEEFSVISILSQGKPCTNIYAGARYVLLVTESILYLVFVA